MPLRQIKIVVDAPMLPKTGGVTHTATSYQIAKDKDFSKQDNILAEELKSQDLTTHYFTVDLDYDDIIFVRCKHHFTKDGKESESGWSRVVPVNSLQTGIKVSSSIVQTPNVTVEDNDDLITIKTSDFVMYTGGGDHLSTDYSIMDTDNEVIFLRENDKDNLTSIYIKDKLESGKLYLVGARHTNTTNNSSYYGKAILENFSPNLNLFTFETVSDFVKKRKFYYRVKIWISNFESYDLEVRNSANEIVYENKASQQLTTHFIPDGDKFVLNASYDIFVRLHYTTGETSEWKKGYTTTLYPNSLYNINSSVVYADKYEVQKQMNTGGITCITSKETFDNKLIGVDYESNALFLFRYEEGQMKLISTLYEFDQNLDIDYINIKQLANHDILVDIVVYNSKKQAYSMFLIFDYNPIAMIFTLLKQVIRKNEKYSTSISNSLVITGNNEVYYIPAYFTNGETEDRQWLRLAKFDIESGNIEYHTLPYDAKYYANIIMDKVGGIYVFGGSQYPDYDQDDQGRRVEIFKNHIKDIYKLDKTTNTFNLYHTLPDYYPHDVYNIQPILRNDGLIILFNACSSGTGVENNKFLTYDPVIKTWNQMDINGKINVPIRSNFIFNNGDILRFTSKVHDPQSVIMYHSNTKSAEDIEDFEDISKEPVELVIENDDVVLVEDLYKYTKIEIKGNGILKWYRPQGITILTSRDLIVYKNTQIDSNTLATKNYEQILVLDGVDFQITHSGSSTTTKPPTTTKKVKVVKFNSNGGSGEMKDVNVELPESGVKKYTVPASTFTAPTNKQFKTWSEVKDGSSKTHDVNSTIDFGNPGEFTLYAIWENKK